MRICSAGWNFSGSNFPHPSGLPLGSNVFYAHCPNGIMGIITQKITPHLWFDKEAKEAAEFYASIFPNSKINNVTTIRDTPSGDCDIVTFELYGQPFMAISAGPLFKFNESISFMVSCDTQKEIDYYWEKLSAVPEAEQCGWLKDKYGLSWQIVPSIMDEMMKDKDEKKIARVTEAFLKMKKFDIAELKRAYGGNQR
jgi:predicted 3-demethylubiquinone-9 3-methyltransferase (glyoxalase superfamily)